MLYNNNTILHTHVPNKHNNKKKKKVLTAARPLNDFYHFDEMNRKSALPRRSGQISSEKRRSSVIFIANDDATPLTRGREGAAVRKVAESLRAHKDLSEEKIELIYETFQMFPLDSTGRLTPASLSNYYRNVGLIYSSEQCMEMISLFVGGNTTAMTFEDFALAYVRCEKSLPVSNFFSIVLPSHQSFLL